MTSTSLDISDKPELRLVAELVRSVDSAAGDDPFLIVGASALELVVVSGYGVSRHRRTKDVDFAIRVADWARFEKLRNALVEQHGFQGVERAAAHRLLSPAGFPVDLLPFGAVERPDRTIAWPPDDDPVMTTLGFSEILQWAVGVRLPDGVRAEVASPAGITLLKVIAWADRPPRDAEDIGFLLRNYIDAGNQHRFYDDEQLLKDTDGDRRLAGAILLGRDTASMLDEPSLAHVQNIVAREADPSGALRLAGEINRHDPDTALRLIGGLHDGLGGR
jgi:predicted nucleotidyltransferase